MWHMRSNALVFWLNWQVFSISSWAGIVVLYRLESLSSALRSLRKRICLCRYLFATSCSLAADFKSQLKCDHVWSRSILVPIAHDPSGLRQESRALGATISGMRHRCRLRETGWAEFGYFLSYFKMVAPRALVLRPLVKGNWGSGNEIGRGGLQLVSGRKRSNILV